LNHLGGERDAREQPGKLAASAGKSFLLLKDVLLNGNNGGVRWGRDGRLFGHDIHRCITRGIQQATGFALRGLTAESFDADRVGRVRLASCQPAARWDAVCRQASSCEDSQRSGAPSTGSLDNKLTAQKVLPLATLRLYHPGDAGNLLALFRDTIRRVNSRDYSPDQVAAWASDDIDTAAWAERFRGRYVVVAEEDAAAPSQRLVGFAELETNGHIDRLYVSADHQGQGIATLLLSALVQEAQRQRQTRLFVEASITARPFFEKHGFTMLAEQVVTLRGVAFVNCRMERWLDAADLPLGSGLQDQ
jgi:putative acetyltransferase